VINKRRREIAAELARIGFCLPGTLVERSGRCGKPGCACHTDPERRHGPYRSWTRKVGGKTITKNLTDDQVARYAAWFDNARRLQELITELQHLSHLAMAQHEGWAQPPAPPPDRRRRPTVPHHTTVGDQPG
jgi:hypothetical protein